MELDSNGSNDYQGVLSESCALHRTISDKHSMAMIKPSQPWARDFLSQCRWDVSLSKLHETLGTTVYDKHAVLSVKEASERVEANVADLHTARASIGNGISLTAQVRKMARPSSLAALQPQVGSELRDLHFGDPSCADSVRNTLGQLPHRKNKDHLAQVTEAIGMDALRVRGTCNDSGDACDLPWPKGLRDLDIFMSVRDVTLLAFVVAPHFEMGCDDMQDDPMSNRFRAFCSARGLLEGQLFDLKGSTVEATYQLPIQDAVCYLWSHAMAALRGFFLQRVLEIWRGKIQKASMDLKNLCPPWSACFQGGQCDMSMMGQLCKGRASPLIQQHNKLHDLLATFGSTATAMQVTSKLQSHGATSRAIGVALFTLREASAASAVIQGVNVLHQFQFRIDGPKEPADLLKTTAPDVIAAMPGALQSRLRCLAADLSVGGAPTPSATEAHQAGQTAPGAGAARPTSCASAGAAGSMRAKRECPSSLARKAPSTRAMRARWGLGACGGDG